MTKAERIQEAKRDGRKAGEWLKASRVFEGSLGRATLSAFADCVVEANRALAGKGSPASDKWAVNLEWSQGTGYGSGILALNFGNRYLSCCRHDGILRVLVKRDRVDRRAVPLDLDVADAFENLPGSSFVELGEATMTHWQSALRPAYIETCNDASQVYQKLHARSYSAHAPGLLQFLRDELGRTEIPDPTWIH